MYSRYGIPVVGTMAHSFIQSYDNELSAFRDFAAHRGENCFLLVDTYDTLKSGVPNAITVAKEMARVKGGYVPDIGRLRAGNFYAALEGTAFAKITAPWCLSQHPHSPLTTEEVLDLARR